MKPLDLITARKIIDFSGGDPSLENLASMQLNGAVALHNMIADPKIGMGYLADEVGMGKTYVALGVVTLMRYFNPSLRVLYICPSRNVQDKWDREYKGFINHNVIVSQYRIRTAGGKPAAPYVSCRNLAELIKMATIGYYADFFVGKDSFSMGLTDDEDSWKARLKSLKQLLPAHEISHIRNTKRTVKLQYARALNYVLPTFDLVIIDEAHNFKHDFNSSDRNQVLSNVLGIQKAEGSVLRVRNALLLSATPYDRNIDQLRNQLKLVGKERLLPDEIENTEIETIKQHLNKFMVRRLNVLNINEKLHTRNMYRKEWRTGERAEIKLDSDEQKLIMALVQKKVGDMLGKRDGSPAYQMGMLASFESFAETTKSPPVEFDGEKVDKKETDAQDRHVVGQLVDSYKDKDLGNTLPHPKMDSICKSLSMELFERNRKQLVFVRRVKSVKELKEKLDDAYNEWIMTYLLEQLDGHEREQKMFHALFQEYRIQSKHKDEDISEGEYVVGEEGDAEDNQPPKNDTFFAWFFRGVLDSNIQKLLAVDTDFHTTPFAVRVGLTAKNQPISRLMEINWAWYVCLRTGFDILQLLEAHKPSLSILVESDEYLDVYRGSQIAFIEWYVKAFNADYLTPLVNHLSRQNSGTMELQMDFERLKETLAISTLFTEIEKQGLSNEIFPLQGQVFEALQSDSQSTIKRIIDKCDIHRLFMDICLRTGHGIIDIYLNRIRQGPQNLDETSRSKWMSDLVGLLKEQKDSTWFSTYHELAGLASHLDLLIKTNTADILDEPHSARKQYLSQRLNPVSPVIGATGATLASRSAQAAKFRMPGYPLALISTDVFQEGEDLHTFCDSVVHYGLSGSPVSIEQKTGRVDRVNSLAQRRLLNISGRQVAHDDYIQVTFPYVKESIEFLQVRQLCTNINEFIRSLHEIRVDKVERQDNVEPGKALLDSSIIPEQVTDYLQSPYEPIVEQCLDNSVAEKIDKENKRVASIKQHVNDLVSEVIPRWTSFDVEKEIAESHLRIKIDSARSTGELLIIANTDEDIYFASQNQLRQWMKKKSWDTLYRICAVENARGTYQLTRNSEMLIGDSNVTQARDIELFVKRFSDEHKPKSYKRPTSQNIMDNYENVDNGAVNINGNDTHIFKIEGSNPITVGIQFSFGEEALTRQHVIWLYETDGRCVFLSKVATKKKISQFDDHKIIELTWIRNSNIDLVEFMLNNKGELMGRVVHASDSLDWDELYFVLIRWRSSQTGLNI